MTHTTTRAPLARLGALVAIVALFATLALSSVAQAAQFEGKVTSKDSGAKTFRINQGEGEGKVRFHTNGSTNYEGLSGFGAIERGMKVSVIAHRASGHLVADKVERE